MQEAGYKALPVRIERVSRLPCVGKFNYVCAMADLDFDCFGLSVLAAFALYAEGDLVVCGERGE